MNQATLPRLSADASVFRFVKRIKDHFPPGDEKPLPLAFRPTKADYDDAHARGIAPMLSVWDVALTAVAEAHERLPLAAEETFPQDAHERLPPPEPTYTPLRLGVGSVEAIEVPGLEQPLTVHSDPVVDDKPGAEGHAGIAGLAPPEGATKERKRVFKALWACLPPLCEPMGD